VSALPPDWAIERALTFAPSGPTLADVKRHWPGHTTIIAFARYIAKHEQEPVDPLYEALKAVAELGRYDTREQTQLLRGELAKWGMAVVDIAPLDGLGPILDTAEGNASGKPDWQVISSRVNAARAMIAKARGES
jgi:hypothetical protein